MHALSTTEEVLGTSPILSASDVHKSYGGVHALRGVHLELARARSTG